VKSLQDLLKLALHWSKSESAKHTYLSADAASKCEDAALVSRLKKTHKNLSFRYDEWKTLSNAVDSGLVEIKVLVNGVDATDYSIETLKAILPKN